MSESSLRGAFRVAMAGEVSVIRFFSMRWLALAMLFVACTKSVPDSVWLREVPGSIEGAWESKTPMGEKEGGVCTLTFTPEWARLRCSPGPKDDAYRYHVVSRSTDALILELTPEGADAAPARLEIESLRNERGERALRIRDVLQPAASPLGAYGQPHEWVETSR